MVVDLSDQNFSKAWLWTEVGDPQSWLPTDLEQILHRNFESVLTFQSCDFKGESSSFFRKNKPVLFFEYDLTLKNCTFVGNFNLKIFILMGKLYSKNKYKYKKLSKRKKNIYFIANNDLLLLYSLFANLKFWWDSLDFYLVILNFLLMLKCGASWEAVYIENFAPNRQQLSIFLEL